MARTLAAFINSHRAQPAVHKVLYTGCSDITESMVTIRSPCCGYNLALCVELKGEDLSSY